MKALNNILARAKADPRRIVLCEGQDMRVVQAAVSAAEQGLAQVMLVGDPTVIAATAREAGLEDGSLGSCELIDPATSEHTARLAEALHAHRAAKGMTAEQAAEKIRDPLIFANMLVREGLADGSVAGAVNTTADVVRSAIQLLGLAPGSKLVSSFFLMMLCKPFHNLKGGMIFSDCGLVIDPDAEELSQIALAAADSAQALLGEDPRVAMLSFSTTNGSAHHASVDKVVQAAHRVRRNARRSPSMKTCSSTPPSWRKSPSASCPPHGSRAPPTCWCSPIWKLAISATSSPNASAAPKPSARCSRASPNPPTTSRAAAPPPTSSMSLPSPLFRRSSALSKTEFLFLFLLSRSRQIGQAKACLMIYLVSWLYIIM